MYMCKTHYSISHGKVHYLSKAKEVLREKPIFEALSSSNHYTSKTLVSHLAGICTVSHAYFHDPFSLCSACWHTVHIICTCIHSLYTTFACGCHRWCNLPHNLIYFPHEIKLHHHTTKHVSSECVVYSTATSWSPWATGMYRSTGCRWAENRKSSNAYLRHVWGHTAWQVRVHLCVWFNRKLHSPWWWLRSSLQGESSFMST